MLQIELDILSGMPNPTWVLSQDQESTLYELLDADPAQIARVPILSRQIGLGYRGFVVRRIKTDDGVWDRAVAARGTPFPNEFRVGLRGAEQRAAARWLLETAPDIADGLREVASQGVVRIPRGRGPIDPASVIDPAQVPEAELPVDEPYALESEEHETWWDCGSSSYFSANAHFFNDPAHVGRNNCYCFGSNHMPDIRYARPGQRGGRPCTSMNCDNVIDGLRADGWKDGCQPTGLTIVMVIWPGVDYHFYRLVTGGPYWWWGHKPGGTPARYTDECGHAMYQYQGRGYAPNNICRGEYSDFCGYFYQDNWTAYVA